MKVRKLILDPSNGITKSTIFLAIGTILFFSVSCSKRLHNQATIDEVIVYPSPPDTARIQFLTSISNSLQVVGKKSSFTTFIFGEDKESPIKKP